jgi:hypothetical protein
MLQGWFSATGEWILFPSEDFEDYDPFKTNENEKCVSLINRTGSDRSQHRHLDGTKVVVLGAPIRYDDLPIGVSSGDRLLSKRYFENESVENYCLRDFVFVVSSFRKA